MTDSKTSAPMYRQIMDYILGNINSGAWPVHERVPSEAQLVKTFQTSRMTVNRALRELTKEGRLIRRQGNGTFVAPAKAQTALLEIHSIADEITRSGGSYSCTVHLLCEEKASPEIAQQMDLQSYSRVYHSIIVHKNNGTPILLADRFINPAIAPNYLAQDFSKQQPTEYLLKIAPVEKINHVVEALIPPAWIRDLLEVNESEPCLTLYRTTWSKSVVATRSSFYYPGSRYSLGGTFSTSSTGDILIV